eukprot:CAMPEP_0181315862 /NCGR_PEP_ID=MMETSP1101-20121128/15595_1 /TAXON_ID=46948 /ORGANISM="Rhodomonas abbreviata, Strain Caron Lab Isolate" /LENGTH=174 /DNA_ID=CAMNT_0023423085 /DNA_START=112 /DNA_END=636 /DNA_ORIENTATION=+
MTKRQSAEDGLRITKFARAKDFLCMADYVSRPNAMQHLTTALKHLKSAPEAEFPSEQMISSMDAVVQQQSQQLERVQELLKEATDILFTMHLQADNNCQCWTSKQDSGGVLLLELEKDVTSREYYRDTLCDVETCYHSVKLYRENLGFQLSFQEVMHTVQKRREELRDGISSLL